MILDIELDKDLIISFFDKEGKIKIKKFKIDKPFNWTLCSDFDSKKDPVYKNWDGKSVKKIECQTQYLNKWSIYEFIHNLPQEEKAEISELNFPKIQSIDIETEVIDSFPIAEIAKEKITTIAVSTESNNTVVLGWKPISKEQEKKIFDEHRKYLKNFDEWSFKYICFEDEYNMLYTFINKFLPNFSLVVGWNFISFDWKYICNRCKRLGIDIRNASPTKKLSKADNIPLHIGMMDYLEIYKRWDRTVAIKENNSLDFVATSVLNISKLKYNKSLQEMYEEDYDKYILYNAIDSALVCLIHKKLKTLNSILSMSGLCDLPIYKSQSAVNLTEALIWKGYYQRNQVIADKKGESIKGSYEGAYVKEPHVGMFSAVSCFDYASLYPSIMRQFNVSPESFIEKQTDNKKIEKYKNDKNYIVAINGAIYDSTKVSVLKDILTNLYTERKKNKNKHLEIERKLSKNNKK